jgi:predicted nucleotidyltransferase
MEASTLSSGKFIVRMTKVLHSALKREAAAADCSLNELCVNRLRLPSGLESLPSHLADAIGNLTDIAGPSLLGIVVFGSWARQDHNAASDIDVLVVLKPSTKITRDLYRIWEHREPADSKVEPHFVTLPDLNERVTGLWAEVSLDGLVIFDGHLRVQRYLQYARHLIRSGKLVAKRLHGQNYWVHEGVA